MSYHRFFLDDQILSKYDDAIFDVRLSDDDLKHMKAARIIAGETVAIIDASSDYFQCEVIELKRHGFTARISSSKRYKRPAFSIDLFQGIPKAGKLEKIVRHATEIGANAFYPVAFERCVAKYEKKNSAAKIERLQKIAKSAAVQAGRDIIPKVSCPITFLRAIELLCSYDATILFWEEASNSASLRDVLADMKIAISNGQVSSLAIVVGPEGGISDSEVEAILNSVPKSHISTLGPNILRTETAGIVGCALVSYELGGMGGSLISEQYSLGD